MRLLALEEQLLVLCPKALGSLRDHWDNMLGPKADLGGMFFRDSRALHQLSRLALVWADSGIQKI